MANGMINKHLDYVSAIYWLRVANKSGNAKLKSKAMSALNKARVK